MRIAGRQVYETMRIAAQVQSKQQETRDPGKGGTNDGTVTTQDGVKPSLFDVLWGDPSQSGQTPGHTAGHAATHPPHQSGATSGHKPQQPAASDTPVGSSDKPSDSQVDIYV